MKVNIIGGGPAGLYFAILMKKAWPRRASRSTSATGRTTPSASASCSPTRRSTPSRPTTRDLSRDHRRTSPTGTTSRSTSRARVHRIGGNGFCGCSRATLLSILHERAPRARRRAQVPDRGRPTSTRSRDADLVVAADGINSRDPRALHATHFQPDDRPAAEQVRLAGLDARRSTPSPSSSARPSTASSSRTATSTSRAARPGSSRPTPETFERAGLDKLDEAAVARACSKRIFAEELDGHRLLTNRSLWRNFPTHPQRALGRRTTSCCSATPRRPRISPSARAPSSPWRTRSRCTRRSARPAAAMQAALDALRDRAARRGREDPARRRRVAGLVRAPRRASGTWTRCSSPSALMTRSKAITYDNLRLRAPDFVDEVDR